jgi:hypothetical protein
MYEVVWRINVSAPADDPIAAAQAARDYQRPGTTATVFEVSRDSDGATYEVDLTGRTVDGESFDSVQAVWTG